MISHQHQCIFIHQRKCAGTSVINSFGLTLNDPDWHHFNDGMISEKPWWSSAENEYSDYFVFSIIRNPWDRFISAWKYLPATRDRDLEDVLKNLPQTGHDFRHITRPQSAILVDRNGELITDYLVQFEDIQTGYNKVCETIGKEFCQLPVTNQTSRDHYSVYFKRKSTRDLFEKVFWADIEKFGYKFEDKRSIFRKMFI